MADGVLYGVMPPAGNFSRQRKVTKSWLRTYGSKDSLVLTWNDRPPWLLLLWLPPTLRRRVMVPLIPRFGALLWWVDAGAFVYRFFPQLSCCGVGKSYSIGNCRSPNNHQGSAPKRGNRGTRSPRCCVSGTQTKQEHQDNQHKETKESLEPLVLSGLLPTFLPREK